MVSRGKVSGREEISEEVSACEETVGILSEEPIGSCGIAGRGIGVEAFALGEDFGDTFGRVLEDRGDGVIGSRTAHDAPAEDTSD